MQGSGACKRSLDGKIALPPLWGVYYSCCSKRRSPPKVIVVVVVVAAAAAAAAVECYCFLIIIIDVGVVLLSDVSYGLFYTHIKIGGFV